MFYDFNESPDNLVEIELCVNDLSFPLPVRGRDGLLDFQDQDYAFSPLMIRVPKEVAEDPYLLRKYYYQTFQDHHILGVPRLNIWDSDKDDFKFPW
jgi:hypothetical protein